MSSESSRMDVTSTGKSTAQTTPQSGCDDGAARTYASRIQELVQLDLDEAEAAEVWRAVLEHRRTLRRELGRDVGQRLAFLDYFTNLRPLRVEFSVLPTSSFETLQRGAISDLLSGLHNRNYFQSVLRRDLARSYRFGGACSLILFDLDNFKRVNDRHGRSSGDRVLEVVGRLIRKNIRLVDVPCRYGGDEFAILLVRTPMSASLGVAERIRAQIQSWFETRAVYGNHVGVTVSGGVAELTAEVANPDSLLITTHHAMQLAKNAGGNRIATTSGCVPVGACTPSRPSTVQIGSTTRARIPESA